MTDRLEKIEQALRLALILVDAEREARTHHLRDREIALRRRANRYCYHVRIRLTNRSRLIELRHRDGDCRKFATWDDVAQFLARPYTRPAVPQSLIDEFVARGEGHHFDRTHGGRHDA